MTNPTESRSTVDGDNDREQGRRLRAAAFRSPEACRAIDGGLPKLHRNLESVARTSYHPEAPSGQGEGATRNMAQ